MACRRIPVFTIITRNLYQESHEPKRPHTVMCLCKHINCQKGALPDAPHAFSTGSTQWRLRNRWRHPCQMVYIWPPSILLGQSISVYGLSDRYRPLKGNVVQRFEKTERTWPTLCFETSQKISQNLVVDVHRRLQHPIRGVYHRWKIDNGKKNALRMQYLEGCRWDVFQWYKTRRGSSKSLTKQ